MAGGVLPVYVLELPRELGSGLEELRTLDETPLHTQFHILLHQALYGFDNQLRAQFHELVVQGSGCVSGLYVTLGAKDDAAGINLMVYHEGGDTGDVLSIDHSPVDGGGAAVLGQQGGVQVEAALPGHAPDGFRQHAEAYNHKQVCLPGG